MLPTIEAINRQRATWEDFFQRTANRIRRDFPNGEFRTLPNNGEEFVGVHVGARLSMQEDQIREFSKKYFPTFAESKVTREGDVLWLSFAVPCPKLETIERESVLV
jgi:hypothetical protein